MQEQIKVLAKAISQATWMNLRDSMVYINSRVKQGESLQEIRQREVNKLNGIQNENDYR